MNLDKTLSIFEKERLLEVKEEKSIKLKQENSFSSFFEEKKQFFTAQKTDNLLHSSSSFPD